EWDQGVQQRLGSVTEKYKPFEPLLNGRTPEYLQQAVQFADLLDQAPEQIYENLGRYLQSTGRLPAPAQGQQQQPGQEPQEEQPEVDDPRLAQLQEQQERINQFLIQQHQEQLRRQAESQLDAEIRQLREKHN